MKNTSAQFWLTMAALLGAAAIGVSGHDGWGWLLFFAFVMIA